MVRDRLCARLTLLAAGMVISTALEAAAQPLGAFRWQLLPYCNVITLNVTAQGTVFTLDGYDDQCGAGQRASVVGTAFPNPVRPVYSTVLRSATVYPLQPSPDRAVRLWRPSGTAASVYPACRCYPYVSRSITPTMPATAMT